MKKAGFVLLAIGFACAGLGCASTGKAAIAAQKDPIALVSVVSNVDIVWKGEEPIDPDNAGPFSRRALRADPDMALVSGAEDLIERAETLIRDHIAVSGQISLAEKETVFGSRAYQEAELNKYQINRDEVKPAAYRYVDYRDDNFPPALAAETGIQRSMYLQFTFTKAMATGIGKIGSCRAMVDMEVFIMDARGKRIYRKIFSLASRENIKVSGGVYSSSGLMGLFESAITDICYEFLDDLSY